MNPALQSLQQSQQDRRAMLAAWRASQVVEFQIPSGLTISLRDITMQDIALSGQMPNTLLNIFLDEEQDIDKMPEKQQILRMMEAGKDFTVFLDLLVTQALIWPAIGEKHDEDHITLDELRQSDKMAIMQWLNREAIATRPFREEPAEPVETAQPGGDLRPDAQ